MSLTWKQREQRREWYTRNPDKQRQANRDWRAANLDRVRRQARERMRRFRRNRRSGNQS